MLKKTLNLKGAKTLSTTEQKEIIGGFWGFCRPQLLDCNSDNDCPSCSSGCGISYEINGQSFSASVCAF